MQFRTGTASRLENRVQGQLRVVVWFGHSVQATAKKMLLDGPSSAKHGMNITTDELSVLIGASHSCLIAAAQIILAQLYWLCLDTLTELEIRVSF